MTTTQYFKLALFLAWLRVTRLFRRDHRSDQP